MAFTDFYNILTAAGAIVKATLLTALEKRSIYVLADAETPASLTPGNVLYLAFQGRIFRYDATDSTTANDGVTCIVTADGKRFKADGFGGAQARFVPVQSLSLNTPPVSPTLGQTWIVATGGTGAWAGKDKYFATWSARQWVFTVPNPYDIALVIDQSLYYSYTVIGTWASGLPAMSIGANTIVPSMIKYSKFGFRVINQTTNTPPVSPSDGDAYIVGPSPTGAWAGHSLNIANYESGAWVFYTGYIGASVYDSGIGASVVCDGTRWVASVSGYSGVADIYTFGQQNSGNVIATPTTYWAFSLTAAPTTSSPHDVDASKITYTAKKAGANLEFTYDAIISPYSTPSNTQSAPFTLTAALFVDSNAAASDWILVLYTLTSFSLTVPPTAKVHANVTFRYVVPDIASHVYSVAFFAGDVGATSYNTLLQLNRRQFILRERA